MAADLENLFESLRGRRLVILTGAGVSTESGIPDYRSPESLARPRRPLHGPEFVRSAALRRRYWARSMVGWERFSSARPCPAHHAIAALERDGIADGVITQNVDRLHDAAGSKAVTELHGALAETVCLECGAIEARSSLQTRLVALNPAWRAGRMTYAPDGDADIPEAELETFVTPGCLACGGVIKPNVVFFGHNVPRPIVDEAFARIDRSEALLVAGTSLAVFSGYRFLLRAAERKIPIAIVNRGPVRGEERARIKVDASTSETLTALATRLAG